MNKLKRYIDGLHAVDCIRKYRNKAAIVFQTLPANSFEIWEFGSDRKLDKQAWQYYNHTCQPIRLKILEIHFFLTLRSHSSKPLPPTASILSYLSSAQEDLTVEPQ